MCCRVEVVVFVDVLFVVLLFFCLLFVVIMAVLDWLCLLFGFWLVNSVVYSLLSVVLVLFDG